MEIPFITADQMREVDRLMTEEYAISLPQMMENAGRNLARAARVLFFDVDPRGHRVDVLCGAGGNGGGGMVCARRLTNWGAEVTVWLTRPAEEHRGVPAKQLGILQAMDTDIRVVGTEPKLSGELAVDALIGYSLAGAPSGPAAALIRAANNSDSPVLSLDVPSGVDAGTGAVYEPAVRADATLTLALPKTGLRSDAARKLVGDLHLTDIGVPPELYARPGLELDVGPLFYRHEIIRIW